MTAPPAGALEACLALLEKATVGEWEVVQGDEWTTDIGTPEGEYEDGRKRHWNVASVNRRRDEWEANRQLIAAAVNLLRTHGPALLAALRLREGLEGLEKNWRESATEYVSAGAFVKCADDLARVLEEGE